MRRHKLVIVLDFDDTLCPMTKPTIDILNKKYGWKLKFEDIKWGLLNFGKEVSDAFYHEFDLPEVYRVQTPYPGAVKMVQALVDAGHDVIIASAVNPEFMSVRAEQIARMFPMIDKKNILLGHRKDTINADILLDDAPHNIERSRAKYPILFRMPWNTSLSGMLSVNNYNDFLNIVNQIAISTTFLQKKTNEPRVICLIGPSGAGKTSIARKLAENPMFALPRSATTRKQRPGEPEEAYHFVTSDEFEKLRENGSLLETTVYAGQHYGMQKEEINQILQSGRNAVVAIDICGANTIKTVFGNRADTAFVWRDKSQIIYDIITRDVPTDDKVRRIISLDSEFANEHLCDYTIRNTGLIEDAAKQVLEHLEM